MGMVDHCGIERKIKIQVTIRNTIFGSILLFRVDVELEVPSQWALSKLMNGNGRSLWN